jgi:hypothetical protein
MYIIHNLVLWQYYVFYLQPMTTTLKPSDAVTSS